MAATTLTATATHQTGVPVQGQVLAAVPRSSNRGMALPAVNPMAVGTSTAAAPAVPRAAVPAAIRTTGDGHPAVERELFRKPDHHQAAWERQPASWRTPERQSALHRRQGPSRGHADRGQASRERLPAPQKAPEYRPVPQRGGEITGNPRNPSPSRLSSELAIQPTETVELKAWAAEMTAWARNAAAEIRTLNSEVESLQEPVRRLKKTSKAKSATGESKKSVEVVEDFQTPKKTATASRVTNQDSGTQTPGSGSRRWRR